MIESQSFYRMGSLIALTAVSQRPGSSSRIAPLLALAWLCLLPPSEAASECNVPSSANAYRPPDYASPPFDCTGHDSIDLTNRGLPSFDMNATLQFETCSTITTLWLGCNNFVTLERGAFQGLSKLQTLFLRFNPVLHTLIPGVFKGLGKLYTLWLNYNPTLVTLSPRVFEGLTKLQTLCLGGNQALSLESFTEASTDLNQLTKIVLLNSGITAVPNGFFANLPKLKYIKMSRNPSVCKVVDSSAPGKVTCKCASDYFNSSQKMAGGGDGYCLCPAGQYVRINSCSQCPANTYSDVPNTSPNCTSCAPGNISEVGSTDASQCRVNPLLKAQAQLTAETAAKLTAQTTAREASEEKNAALQKAIIAANLTAETTANLTAETAAKLTAETTAREASEERNAAQERENLIIIFSAIAVVLLMVFGGAWLYYLHKTNLALTKQLNEGLLTQVAEQHEEMVYLRNWR